MTTITTTAANNNNSTITTTTKDKIIINKKTREIGRGGNEEENIERFGFELSQKIVNVTEGFTDHFARLLKKQLLESNIESICDYILAIKAESNPSTNHKRNQLQILCYLSEFLGNQTPFIKMTRDNILSYLDSLRKPEESDPDHKWIGTYNLRKTYIKTFFKWLYSPNLNQKNRPTPDVMANIRYLKRKEISTIKPSDLWTAEDNALFLKYCPSKRDKTYHAIARDSSCRPGEILNLKIGDVNFKMSGTNQYAEIVVSGKTGKRSIPLFAAIPYVKDWLDDHPQGRNPNAFLIPSLDKQHKKFGSKMNETSLNGIYRRYKVEIFPRFLEDPKVVPEDKKKIKDLIQNKKWHPYVFRHSALTAKSTVLKEHTLLQHAGWTGKSMMHMKYLHYFGNESNESLLAEYGIVTEANKGNVLLPDSLRPRQCPNCSEANVPDCKFCSKCRMVLTYGAYEETLLEQKNKDDKLKELEDKMNMQQLAQQEQRQAQEVQQKLLEMIAKAMNIHTTGVYEQALQDKNSSINTAEQFKSVTYDQKLQAIAEVKADTNKVIQDVIIPELANMSNHMKNNDSRAAKESVKRMAADQGFKECFLDIDE